SGERNLDNAKNKEIKNSERFYVFSFLDSSAPITLQIFRAFFH
ncbi:MAG: hypothetical protein ACI9O5_002422, partial [Algoriphagus sp.]